MQCYTVVASRGFFQGARRSNIGWSLSWSYVQYDSCMTRPAMHSQQHIYLLPTAVQ